MMAKTPSDNSRSSAASTACLQAPPTCTDDDVHAASGSRSVSIACQPTALVPTGASGDGYDLWAQALQHLRVGDRAMLTSDPLVAAFVQGQTSSQSLPDLLEQVCDIAARKKKHCDAKSWRFELHGRTYILRDVAGKVVEWVNLFKQVGDTAIQYDPVHAALPWAGVRFLLEAITAEKDLMGVLLMAADKAAYLTGRCRIYEILYLHSGVDSDSCVSLAAAQAQRGLAGALTDLYTAILQLLANAIHLYGKSTPARAFRAIVEPTKVTKLVDECQALETRVDIEASNCERASSATRDAALLKLLETYRKPIARTDERVAQLWLRADADYRHQVMCWVSGIPYEKVHETARAGRTPNTGQWLLAHPRFRDWRDCSASTILWLHGMLGAGKTKLASTIIDHLLEEQQMSQNDEALAYFYCDRNRADHQDPGQILRSFVLQLSTSRSGDAVQPCLVEVYEKKKGKGPANPELSEMECSEVLQKLVNIYPQTTIVLDALDEVDKDRRDSLMGALDKLVASATKPVKVLISSRPDVDIMRKYEQGPNVAVEETDNASDIAAFVAQQLDLYEKRQHCKLRRELRREIIGALHEKSHGMFQWVALQVEQLQKLRRDSDLRQRLGQLPPSLQSAYDELHQQIRAQPGSGGEVAERAIRWVMCSREPLRTDELLGAVCQDPDSWDDASDIDIDADFVLDACCNLLVIDPNAGIWRFAHLSVQEYFEDLHKVRRQHEWSYRSAHSMAAKACLLLLTDPDVHDEYCAHYTASPLAHGERVPEDSSADVDYNSFSRARESDVLHADTDDEELAAADASSPCLCNVFRYAALNWAYHVKLHGEDNIDPRVTSLLQRFLGSMDDSERPYQNWMGLRIDDSTLAEFKEDWKMHLQPATKASLTICRLGLYKVLGDWFVTGFRDPNARSTAGKTLLLLAAEAGSVDIVARLIDDGADMFALDDDGDHALAVASYRGAESIVRLLLDRGLDVDMPSASYGNALQAASSKGHERVVRLLLDRGADVNAHGGPYGHALQAACANGAEAVVRIILDGEAKAIVNRGRFGNALHVAAQLGSKLIVRMLLERCADVNAHGSWFGNRLKAACGGGNRAVVQLLLDRGADVNAQGGEFGHALQAAALDGSESVVQLLLERGADAAAEGGLLHHALQAAALDGSEALLRRLLERGAHVNAQGGFFGNALQAAIWRDNNPVVRLLLDRGADVNAQGGFYGHALLTAAHGGNELAVRLLLELGVHVNAPGAHYGYALQAAAWRGNEAIVRRLLERRADVNAHGGIYGNALQAASSRGHEAIVRRLLDCGADVNARGGQDDTALQAALSSGENVIAQLLVDRGAV